MDWNFFILGMCSVAIYFNLKNFFNNDMDDVNIIYNIIVFVLILLISIGRIIKVL